MLYVLLLLTYPWQTLSASALAYLVFLPLSARAYARRAQVEAAKRGVRQRSRSVPDLSAVAERDSRTI